MPTKVGRISRLGRRGSKFVEAYLDSGDKVDLQHPIWTHITETYPPNTELVFVERRGRVFNFVQWVGTRVEAQKAARDGVLTAEEVSEVASADAPDETPDWTEWALRSVHMLFETAKAGQGSEFMDWAERLHRITVLAPFPDLRDHLTRLMKTDDAAEKKQAFEAMMSWCQERLEAPRSA